MDKPIKIEVERLKKLALELRESARTSELPGYAEALVRAAEALETRAAELQARIEISRYIRRD